MVKVAIIDSGIQDKFKQYIKKSYIVNKNQITRSDEKYVANMHGSVCAYILKKYCNDCEIINLNILNENEQSDIFSLKNALQWCIENDIKVVSLSVGSSYFEDKEELKNIISEMQSNHIYIVAAANNHNSITFPASLDGVIGVKCDLSSTLKEGEIFVDKRDLRNIEITVGTLKSIADLEKFELGYNNSYVVPYIAAEVCNAINENKNVWDYIYSDSILNIESDFYINSFPIMYRPEPIIVDIGGDDYDDDIFEYVIKLFRTSGYFAIGITDRNICKQYCYAKSDITWLEEEKKWEYIIKSFNPDIVFTRNIDDDSNNNRDCIVNISREPSEYNYTKKKETYEEYNDNGMQYIGDFGNYGISVSGEMDSIEPENFYFEGDIDEKTKKEIMNALKNGMITQQTQCCNEVIEIRREEINSIVDIIENIF
ncbi:MAG: S8 family serine peptidase [Eubacterium sp.]